MRIITGDLKGRKLYSPANDKVRPTSDVVKESIFNLIMLYVEDSVVVDVFAGTGNLGIEALSRGAKRAYFIDSSKDSVALIKKNIAVCQIEDKSTIFSGDYRSSLDRIKEKVDLIFLDPPFGEGEVIPCMDLILSKELLSPEGIIVVEHSSKEILPGSIGNLYKIKNKEYGTITVSVYEIQEVNE